MPRSLKQLRNWINGVFVVSKHMFGQQPKLQTVKAQERRKF